jgi:hypothetical protein
MHLTFFFFHRPIRLAATLIGLAFVSSMALGTRLSAQDPPPSSAVSKLAMDDSALPPDQVSIRGRTMDAATGETLPAATIQIEGTTRGTVSNAEGAFEIMADSLPVTLVVRYLGYRSRSVSLLPGDPLTLDIGLEPSTMDLPELVITGEDPALSIMERVIARKQLWRPGLREFKATAYTRLTFGSDTSIVMITESVNDVYWDRDAGYREILKSQEKTSNMGDDVIPLGVNSLPNFYDDNIDLLNYSMVGVTHPDALDYYHFKLLDYERIDDRIIYKIGVSPRRRMQPTFEGVVYVLDEEFAILDMRLKPGEMITFPPPIQEVSFTYSQQYSNYGTSFWLPVDSRIEGTVRIGLPGLRFPDIRVNQLARVSEYEINMGIPREVLALKETVTIDSASVSSGRALGDLIDRVPLTRAEAVAYEELDSTYTLEKAFQPKGFLARRFSVGPSDQENASDDDSTGTEAAWRKAWRRTGLEASPIARADRVNGVTLGMGLGFDQSRFPIAMEAEAAYATQTTRWEGGAGVRHVLLTGGRGGGDRGTSEEGTMASRLNASIRWFDQARTRQQVEHISRLSHDMVFLFGGQDIMDHYRSAGWIAGLDWNDRGSSWAVGLQFLSAKDMSETVAELFRPSLGGRTAEPLQLNPSIEDGLRRSLMLEVRRQWPFDFEGSPAGFAGRDHLRLDAELSLPSLGSDFDFLRIGLTGGFSTPTFYRRRFLPNVLAVEASVGTVLGALPVQRLFTIESNALSYAPFGVLKTLEGKPYEGATYWRIHLEHDFKSIPFEWMGFGWPSRKGIGLIAFAGAADAWGGPSTNPISTPRGSMPHMEAGVSLNGIFSLLRVDAAWRLDDPGFFVKFGIARYF